MIIINSCILIGRLSRDPELKFIPSSGMAVTKMSIAVDREMARDKKEEAQAQGKATADFINVTVFGKQAENCANYLTKGSQCAVHGRIQTGSYTDQSGNKRYSFDVIADRVEFIGQKAQAQQGKTGDAETFFGNAFEDEEGVFTPVDDEDMDSIPF